LLGRIAVVAVASVFCLAPYGAIADAGDDDETPVSICSSMPDTAVFARIQRADAIRVCNAMNLLHGVRAKDVRPFAQASAAMVVSGYGGALDDIAKQLAEILVLRGLSESPDRWASNLDIVVRGYQAFRDKLSPLADIGFLLAAGPMAKTLSDEGFTRMLVVLMERTEDTKRPR